MRYGTWTIGLVLLSRRSERTQVKPGVSLYATKRAPDSDPDADDDDSLPLRVAPSRSGSTVERDRATCALRQ